MRYGDDIIKRFIKELEKIPSIRLACNKIGIHHSTYYRWIQQHPTFHKRVSAALRFSRESMGDAAESVIFSGIQKGNVGAAKYYLSNNEQRYMSPAKVDKSRMFEGELINKLGSELPDVEEYPVFEHAFEEIYAFERSYGDELNPQLYQIMINKYAILFARFDTELCEVFKSSYEEWKKDNEDLKEIREKPLDEDKPW